jgi:RNA polymerase sigma factor (sigma-70 family)
MAISTLNGLLEHIRPAERYLQVNFGLDGSSAADIVQDVLLRLLRTGPEHLDRPRRYFFNALRWRALQILRSRKRRDKAHVVIEKRRREKELKDQVVLIALEDEDKTKFFSQATPKQKEVLELLVEGHSTAEVSAILQIPDSTVRMRLHLARKKLNHAG